MNPKVGNDSGGTHRIVVGVDGSDNAVRALEWAAIQAERTSSLLEIHTAFGPAYVFLAPSEVEATTRRLVEHAAKRARNLAPEVAIDCVTHEGSPAPALIEASAGADLLVVGSRGLGGFLGLLLGSVSQQCTIIAVPSGSRSLSTSPSHSRGAFPTLWILDRKKLKVRPIQS